MTKKKYLSDSTIADTVQTLVDDLLDDLPTGFDDLRALAMLHDISGQFLIQAMMRYENRTLTEALATLGKLQSATLLSAVEIGGEDKCFIMGESDGCH